MNERDQAATPCPLLTGEDAGLLLDWCARTLPWEQARALERHMEACPACREMAAQQRMVWEALDAWEVEPPDPSFRRRLYERIEADRPGVLERAQAWMTGVRWRPAVSVAVAGAVLAIVLVRPSARQPEVNGLLVSAEQVESALADLELLEELQLPVK
jgi:anti-sigma-K factor RskA